jgi:glutamate synthase (NADPH/NADH) large chain
VFVNAGGDIDEATFNRKLYLARRRAEKALEADDPMFYVPSLSASTIVYKGMVMPQFLAQFYPDLKDPRMEASVVVFHQRFSTNTLPQWRLAHPFRYLAHNGEINTVQGNRSWAVARGPLFRSPLLPELGDILPVVSLTGSDSQSLDNMLELLLVGGLDPMHAMRMLIPPAWQSVDMIDPDLKAFYEYYATHMEPWDGPAGIVLTDGRYACCTLDRNGLRPARWVITKNRHITIASEAGVWDYLPEDVVKKGKLGPGEILALDLQTAELMDTRRVDDLLKSRHPYKAWLKKGVRYLQTDLIDPRLAAEPFDRDTLAMFQKMFNVSAEERDEIIRVLAEDESEAVGSMGDDTPMPVLSRKVRSLYDYFRQQFAQVTNPPIDSLRESIVMSLQTQIGPECNIFVPAQQHAEQIVLSSPILSQRKLRQIVALADSGVPHEFIDLQYDASDWTSRTRFWRCAIRPRRRCATASWCCCCPTAIRSRASCRSMRCWPPARCITGWCNRAALQVQHPGGDRHGARCASLRLPDRLRRDRGLSVPRLSDPVRPDAQGRAEYGGRYAARTRPQLPPRHPQGAVQDHVQDGHLDHRELPQRAAVRDRRPLRRGGLAVLRGLRQPHPGRGLRRPEARFAVPRSARLERQRKRRAGRLLKYVHGGEYHMYNPDVIATLQAAVMTGDYERYKQFAELVNNGRSRACAIC